MSSICLKAAADHLPQDILKKINDIHNEEFWREFNEGVAQEVLDMENLWSERMENGDEEEDESLPDMDLVEEMTECMRVWCKTHDEQKAVGNALHACSMMDVAYLLEQMSYHSNEVWQSFRNWALLYLYKTVN